MESKERYTPNEFKEFIKEIEELKQQLDIYRIDSDVSSFFGPGQAIEMGSNRMEYHRSIVPENVRAVFGTEELYRSFINSRNAKIELIMRLRSLPPSDRERIRKRFRKKTI